LDQVVRATALGGRARILACVTTDLVNDLQRRHDTWPVATAALGRTASISGMMGVLLKNEERLTVRVKGNGPLGEIVVDADAAGHVRGYVDNPHVDLPSNSLGKLDVGGAVGEGLLYVMRDSGLRDYYTGSSELQNGEISYDFTYYFATSEQTPSAVGAGVLVNPDDTVACSGGFLLQLMPGHTESDISFLESRVKLMQSVTDVLATGISAEQLATHVVPDALILETSFIGFQCTCSRERLERVLISLGTKEMEALISDDKETELVCHFCATRYLFDKENLRGLLSSAQVPHERDGDH
jgi:molecular chaperone Hsp33